MIMFITISGFLFFVFWYFVQSLLQFQDWIIEMTLKIEYRRHLRTIYIASLFSSFPPTIKRNLLFAISFWTQDTFVGKRARNRPPSSFLSFSFSISALYLPPLYLPIKKYLMYHFLYLFFAYPTRLPFFRTGINTIATHSCTPSVENVFGIAGWRPMERKAIVRDIKIRRISNK